MAWFEGWSSSSSSSSDMAPPLTMASTPTPELRLEVVALWRRSSDAEGNPLHRPLTRELLQDSRSPPDPGLQERFPLSPVTGLGGSSDWHCDRQVCERKWVPDPECRALFVQSVENVQRLQALFPDLETLRRNRPVETGGLADKMVPSPAAPQPDTAVEGDGGPLNSFGENLTVSGPDNLPRLLCVGDLFEIRRGVDNKVTGLLEIASPRWPCYKINSRHPTDPKLRKIGGTVQGVCVNTGLAGFFCRVSGEVDSSSVGAGDSLVLTSRVHPHLTLERVSELCYGGRNRITCLIDEFNGTREEEQELLGCEELARFEWRDRIQKCAEKRESRPREKPEEITGKIEHHVELLTDDDRDDLLSRAWAWRISLLGAFIVGVAIARSFYLIER